MDIFSVIRHAIGRCLPLGASGSTTVDSFMIHNNNVVVERVPSSCEICVLFLSLSLSAYSFTLWSTMLNPIAVGFLAPAQLESFASTVISSTAYLFGLSGPLFSILVDRFQDFRPVFLLLIGLNTLSAVAVVLSLQFSSLYLFGAATILGSGLTTCIAQMGIALTASYGKVTFKRTATFSGIYFVALSLIAMANSATVLILPLTENDHTISYVTLFGNVLCFLLMVNFPRWWFKPQVLLRVAERDEAEKNGFELAIRDVRRSPIELSARPLPASWVPLIVPQDLALHLVSVVL